MKIDTESRQVHTNEPRTQELIGISLQQWESRNACNSSIFFLYINCDSSSWLETSPRNSGWRQSLDVDVDFPLPLCVWRQSGDAQRKSPRFVTSTRPRWKCWVWRRARAPTRYVRTCACAYAQQSCACARVRVGRENGLSFLPWYGCAQVNFIDVGNFSFFSDPTSFFSNSPEAQKLWINNEHRHYPFQTARYNLCPPEMIEE